MLNSPLVLKLGDIDSLGNLENGGISRLLKKNSSLEGATFYLGVFGNINIFFQETMYATVYIVSPKGSESKYKSNRGVEQILSNLP